MTPKAKCFKYQGLAIAYLKRFAKHSPDKSSQWVVYEFKQRWFIAIAGSKGI
jgi:hypothetical protein